MATRVPKCAVPDCDSDAQSFHNLPTEKKARDAWLLFIFKRIPTTFNHRLLLCSSHFTSDSFTNLGQYQAGFSQRLMLRSGALPTLLPPHQPETIEQETQDALTQPCIDEEKPQITGFAPNLDPGGSRCSPPENAIIAGTPWTMEKEDKLLELWRQNECLYKLTADKSHDRMEKEEKWTEIAAALELPVEEVKVRATSLRNLYFKLVKAQQPGKKRKPMTMRQRSILTSCRFLTNQINHHSAESSLRDDEISDNEASLLPQHAKKQPRNQNDEDLETQKLALLQHMIDVLQETSREPQRDCEDVFGATVAMELKRIRSLTLRNRVKRQIMTVLYDALDSEPATDPSSYQNVEESNFVTVVIP